MRPVYGFIACMLVAGWCVADAAAAMQRSQATFTGKVVGVIDGDTISVLRNGKQVKVCLWGIDAPESKQPFGAAAKKRLSDLVLGRTVKVQVKDIDRYGQLIAVVDSPALPSDAGIHYNASEWMVCDGYAWWDRINAKKAQLLHDLEKDARAAQIGLWSKPGAIAPWEWRKPRA